MTTYRNPTHGHADEETAGIGSGEADTARAGEGAVAAPGGDDESRSSAGASTGADTSADAVPSQERADEHAVADSWTERPPVESSSPSAGQEAGEGAQEVSRTDGGASPVQEEQPTPADPDSTTRDRRAAPSADPDAEAERSTPLSGVAADSETIDPDDPEDLAGWVDSLADSVIGVDAHAPDTASGSAAAEESDPPHDPEPAGGAPSGGEDAMYRELTGKDGEYQPRSAELRQSVPETSRSELIARLDGLATLVETGRDSLDSDLIARARHLLSHAGSRLRLSSDHTVVALAGGTGSGKSSLFNALCGLEFSHVGITRPTTETVHACVWGGEGSESLLDWLGVSRRNRHSRVSELDRVDSELSGLVLLDLPDHDSVRMNNTSEVDRLIGAVDLIVWVLDPQKYADAAVHHRYLAEMAGHGAVMVTVLNQVDRLLSSELDECLTDLRRLLENESGIHPRLLTASAATGEGIEQLRELLTEAVAERRAAIDRLVADLDRVTGDFLAYGESADHERPGWEGVGERVPEHARDALFVDLASASGVTAVADATETAHERQGTEHVGWPVLRWMRRFRRDPLRRVGVELSHKGLSARLPESLGAQRAEVDAAIDTAAARTSDGLPEPWPARIRDAGKHHAGELPDALGEAAAEGVPRSEPIPTWWRAVRILQYALVAFAGVSLAWLGGLVTVATTGTATSVALLDDPALMLFAVAVCVAALLVGWLTELGCRNLVVVQAARYREQVAEKGNDTVRSLVTERVIAPMENELAKYRRFVAALRAARGAGGVETVDGE